MLTSNVTLTPKVKKIVVINHGIIVNPSIKTNPGKPKVATR